MLGVSSQLVSVVNNHGDRKSPKNRVSQAFNGLAYPLNQPRILSVMILQGEEWNTRNL